MGQTALKIEEQLSDLKNHYAQRLPILIKELEHHCGSLLSSKEKSYEFNELRRKAHSLIGSSSMYEFSDISRKTRDFENLLISISNPHDGITPIVLEKLRSHIIALKSLAQRSSNACQNTQITVTQTPLTMPPQNILIATDDNQIKKKLTLDLSHNKHQLTFCNNGQETIEQFIAKPIDLVIIEIFMPIMDGFQTTYQLKKIAMERYVPVLFLTSSNRQEELVKCIECGGDDFLQKPYDTNVLNAKVFSLMRMSRRINRLENAHHSVHPLFNGEA